MQLNYKIENGILHLLWDRHLDAHHYKIMGMSQTFVYYTIDIKTGVSYDLPMGKYGCYIRFKIIAESENDSILEESNEINISYSDIEKFDITALDGYYGTTLGFRSRGVYDLYKIYDKNILVAETEDPILNLPHKISKNKLSEITVEGYMRIDDKYVLSGISGGMVELPGRGKSDYKISVVIPVYNAETFLPRTVDSILSSSMSDIEIILIDDGSKDDSLKICRWYGKKYGCVLVVQQRNQGVCVARNKGMSLAQAKYLGFVDNDDIVHPFMYENLYNTCKTENTDISIAVTLIRKDINEKEFYLNMPKKKERVITYTFEEVIKNKNNKDNMYFVAVWNKIVKTTIARKVQFPTGYPTKLIMYEDVAYTPTLYSYIDKFALCKDAFYIWDKRKQKTVGTASTTHQKESPNDIWKACIYANSYPIYNGCKRHSELANYASFKRLIERYDKFKESSPLYEYRNEKLVELINKQKLYDNDLIMGDNHLKDIVDRLRT